MAKKTRKADAPAPPRESLAPRGKILILAGGISVLLGFFVLASADPLGRDWASRLCPFLILGGYALIGGGLFLPPPPAVP